MEPWARREDHSGMHTFDATLRPRSLALAVVIPPLAFWSLVQLFVLQAGEGGMPPLRIALLMALAQAIPLTALGWILCGVAAYTVAPGKLIQHRVLRDREFALGPEVEVRMDRPEPGEISVRLPERILRLRVAEAGRCLALLREATGVRAGGGGSVG